MFANKRKFNKMDGICRICMSSNRPVRSLFEVDNDLIELHIKLYTCFPTFNFDDSDFPTAMCSICVKMLQIAYKFRELCVKSTCTFLKKRKNKNVQTTLNNNETFGTNTELNTQNLLNKSDVSTSTDEHQTDTFNISDVIVPHPSTSTILRENEKNNSPESTSVSNEISENNEAISDKIVESQDKVLNNVNKKSNKMFPLNSLESESNNNEKQNSTQPPELTGIDIHATKNKEVQGDNIDNISEKLYMLNNFVLLKDKNIECLNNAGSCDENSHIVHRINEDGGGCSSVIHTNEQTNVNPIDLSTNHKTSKSSEQNISISNTTNKTDNNLNEICLKNKENEIQLDTNLPNEETINEEINSENSLINYLREIDPNHFLCSIPIANLNKENQKDLNEKCLNNNKSTEKYRFVNEEDEDSSSENESLLKPLENYRLNNFINSSLAYHEENSENIKEHIEFQDEVEIMTNSTYPSEECINTTTNNKEENDMSVDKEIELTANLLDAGLKIKNIVSLREENNTEGVTKPLIEYRQFPLITPVPIAKLLSNTFIKYNEPLEDDVDDLVNQNVTEVFDFKNHNDHSYAAIPYDPVVHNTSHLPKISLVKRKRRASGRLISLKISKDTESNMYKAIVIEKPEKKLNLPNPETSKKVRKRSRAKSLDKGKEILTAGPSKLIPIQNKDVSSESISKIVKRSPYGTRASFPLDNPKITDESIINKDIPKVTNEAIINKRVSKILNKPIIKKKTKKVMDESIITKNLSTVVNEAVINTDVPKAMDEAVINKDVPKAMDEAIIKKKVSKVLDKPIIKKKTEKVMDKPIITKNLSKDMDEPIITKNLSNDMDEAVINKDVPTAINEAIINTNIPKTTDESSIDKDALKITHNPYINKNAPNPMDENIPKITDEPFSINKDIPKVTDEPSSINKDIPLLTDEPLINKDTPKSTDENKTIKPKVKRRRIKKSAFEPFKDRKKRIPVEIKTNDYSKITRTRKKPSKEKVNKPETPNESDPMKNEETEEEVPIKKPRVQNKNNETSSPRPLTQADFTAMKLSEIKQDMNLTYPYECDLCGLQTHALPDFEEHLALHMGQEFKSKLTCKYCERTFNSIAGYKMHKMRIHKNLSNSELTPEQQKDSHLCKVCDKVFPSRSSWFFHKKVHDLNKSQ